MYCLHGQWHKLTNEAHKIIHDTLTYSTGHKYCNISTGVLVDFHMIHYTQIIWEEVAFIWKVTGKAVAIFMTGTVSKYASCKSIVMIFSTLLKLGFPSVVDCRVL